MGQGESGVRLIATCTPFESPLHIPTPQLLRCRVANQLTVVLNLVCRITADFKANIP